MERYSTYKDSGIDWIGEIPEHWEIRKLRSFFQERRAKVSDKDYPPLSVTKKGILPQLENVAKSNNSENRKMVCVGDFVINSRSDRKGSSGISAMNGSVSLINIVLEPKYNSLISDYCNYLLKSHSFTEEYYRNGRGIVADLWTTRYEEMKSINLPLPSLPEQKKIAEYLDRVTGKIDTAIDNSQRMIDLLTERKQIIIQHAVTKGLNPKAKLSDSGIDWIGEIPEHWEISPLKHIIKFINGFAFNSNNFHFEGEVPVIRIGDILADKISYDNIAYVNRDESLQSFLTQKGDLLIAMSGATTGKVGIDNKGGSYINQRVGIIRGRYIKYVFYWLNTFIFKDYIFLSSQGSAQPNISSQGIENFRICISNKDKEIRAIAEYLDRVTGKIDKAIEAEENKIKLLTERKQIIISETVTGKVKVI